MSKRTQKSLDVILSNKYYECSFAVYTSTVSAEVGVGNNVRHIDIKKKEERTSPDKKLKEEQKY
jgi:hypothetical protein